MEGTEGLAPDDREVGDHLLGVQLLGLRLRTAQSLDAQTLLDRLARHLVNGIRGPTAEVGEKSIPQDLVRADQEFARAVVGSSLS